MSTVLQVLGAILLAFGIIVLVLGVVALATAVWVRRLWRRKRNELLVQAQGFAVASGASALRWVWTRPLPDRRWFALHRGRRRLHRSLQGAERAVEEALAAGAGVGELPALCRRLRCVATDVDRGLVIAQQATGAGVDVDGLAEQVQELVRAGEQIQRAASLSLASSNGVAAQSLADHVRLEIQAVEAGARVQ